MPLSVNYQPIGGVNTEDNEAMLGDTEVSSSLNFLFEKKQAANRPGQSSIALTGMAGLTIKWASSVVVNATYYTFLVTTTNRLFYVTGSGTAATELTTANALSVATVTDFKPFAVNGAVLFPNIRNGTTGKTVEWVEGAGALAELTSTGIVRYGTAHLFRAVLVRSETASHGQQYLEWSTAGDETVWNTSPSTDGSGNSTLADVPDEFTGAVTLHNVLCLPRTGGIHLGYVTGIAIPPFRFEAWTREKVGCPYPSTIATDANVMMFVGQDDVYTFDLASMTPIGTKVRTTLLALLAAGTVYKGFVTHKTIGGGPRNRYWLVPTGGAAAGSKIFIYDIDDGVWSIHDSPTVINWAFSYMQSGTSQGIGIIDNTATPKILYWDAAQPCDRVSTLVSKAFRIGSYNMDNRVDRVLLSGRDGSGAVNITATATGQHGATSASVSDTQAIGGGGTNLWTRTWFNVRGAIGQDVQVTVAVPINKAFTTDYIGLDTSVQGELRA